jgi:hypothetical protein
VTAMNVRLEDLMSADTCGRWWIVGSAWAGKIQASSALKNLTGNINQTFSLRCTLSFGTNDMFWKYFLSKIEENF